MAKVHEQHVQLGDEGGGRQIQQAIMTQIEHHQRRVVGESARLQWRDAIVFERELLKTGGALERLFAHLCQSIRLQHQHRHRAVGERERLDALDAVLAQVELLKCGREIRSSFAPREMSAIFRTI